jgi:hypothetical protein
MRRLCRHKREVTVLLHTLSTSDPEGDGVTITSPRQLKLRKDPVLILQETVWTLGKFWVAR